MLYQLILLQLAAHLLADFIFQPQVWSDQKGKKTVSWVHFWHISVVFMLSWLLSLDLGFWKAALILGVLHFFVDITKSYLHLNVVDHSLKKYLFFVDQIIHILILILISMAYSKWGTINFVINIPLKNIAILTGFILCAKPGNIIIKQILSLYSISTPEDPSGDNPDKSLPNAGKLIGIVERFLILVLVLAGQYTAVGFIIAAKSILRFNSSGKNEYILVGTLLSFSLAVLIGVLVSSL